MQILNNLWLQIICSMDRVDLYWIMTENMYGEVLFMDWYRFD